VGIGFPLLLALSLVVTSTAAGSDRRNQTDAASATTTTIEPVSVWRGPGPPCKVKLPEPPGVTAYGTFYTCPPKRVMIIGDSVSLSMGIEMELDEENWGIEADNVAILGCGFVIGMQVDQNDKFVNQNDACSTEYSTWRSDAESFKPDLVIVEMGWWDSMLHKYNGQVVQLGQTWYEGVVLARMKTLLSELAVDGSPPVDFLTVPWMDPPKWPNGEHNPGASTAAHDEINALLADAVKSDPSRATLINVSPYVTPEGRFQEYVDGRCRESDGVHMYVGVGLDFVLTHCGYELQKGVLTQVREQLAKK
jgi:hypothetical protein